MKVLTPEQIVERLGKSFDLLTGGGRDLPERQRTLRATLEWSYDLLGTEERRTFARLGIFASSFDLELAETVAHADIDSLQSLVDKSLLMRTADRRFAMLETVRTFAREQLDKAELQTLRRRQLDLLEPLADEAPSWLTGSSVSAEEQVAWADEVQALLPDIREALAWALPLDPRCAGRLICRLMPGFGGRRSELRHDEEAVWMEALLRQRRALPDEVVGEALGFLGFDKWQAGDLDAAAALLRESIELFRRAKDPLRAAWATNHYARTLVARRAYADALTLFEQALADFRNLENQAMVADALHSIGETLKLAGDLDRARGMLREAIATADSTHQNSAQMLHGLADVELDQRRLNEAETHYRRARNTAGSLKNMSTVANCDAGLACVAALRGDAKVAGERWGRAERVQDQIGQYLHAWDRERYERILEPIKNDPAFRRGYETERVAPEKRQRVSFSERRR